MKVVTLDNDGYWYFPAVVELDHDDLCEDGSDPRSCGCEPVAGEAHSIASLRSNAHMIARARAIDYAQAHGLPYYE